MKKIYKYELNLGSGWIELPKGAITRKLGVQGNAIFLWAEVDPREAEKESKCFEVFGTGHEIYEDMGIDRVYVDTVFMGELVWHIYQRDF